MKAVTTGPRTFEWIAEITGVTGEHLTTLVCTDARALLDFVVTHWLGTLDERSRKMAAIWLEISNRRAHRLTLRNGNATANAKIRSVVRVPVTP